MFTQHEQELFDQAYQRALALNRPFEDQEVFQPIWEEEGLELMPQMDSRFHLFREATGTKRRLWTVVQPDGSCVCATY